MFANAALEWGISMRDMTRQEVQNMQGGMITDLALFAMPAGSLTFCRNYEVVESGYRRCSGYERFDGQPSPSAIAAAPDDFVAREAARALIQPVPGIGGILGVVKFKGVVYAFRNAADGLSAKMWKATPTGWVEFVTGVTLAPNGNYRFAIYNFYAQDNQEMLYGCDGQNKAFQFDGATFTQLTTGMAVDKPTMIAAHSMHLFLAYRGGSLLHSATGNPTDWTVAAGAGEIGIGDEITGLNPLVGGVLQIASQQRITMLAGSSSLDWQLSNLRTQDESAGALFGSVHKIAGASYYLTSSGVRQTSAVQAYGDFATVSFSKMIEKVLKQRVPNFLTSLRVDDKGQYRLFFLDGRGNTESITLSFGNGDQPIGFSMGLLPFEMTCANQCLSDSAEETIWYGSSNGYVYQGETGTSFDGVAIEAMLRTAFSAQGAPSVRKRYKRLSVAMNASKNVYLRVKPAFDYFDEDSGSHVIKEFESEAGGGFWGVDRWGQFVWSAPYEGLFEVDIGGNGNSISIYLYSKDAFFEDYTISNMIIDYIPRKLTR